MIARRRFLALGAAALALPARAAPAPLQTWTGTAMGADVTLKVAGATPHAARAFFAEAARVLRGMDSRYSLHRGSDLARLNALGRLAHPSADMLALLALARRVHDATGGAFDPSVQPLWQAVRDGRAPDPALLGFAEVAVGEGGLRLPRRGMALTLNGIAQGWAADRLGDVARAHDLTDILIDTGEVLATGRPWAASVAAPEGRVLRRLTLQGRALATSSPLGTRIGPAGDRPHIIDPRGAAPHWATAAVSAASAAEADALSTAACLLERPAIEAALAAFPGARIEALRRF